MQAILKFIYSTLLVMVAAWLCGIFTHIGIESWYNGYEKPFGTPPNWVFSPMWTLIYALMIISFFMVLNTASHLKKRAVIFDTHACGLQRFIYRSVEICVVSHGFTCGFHLGRKYRIRSSEL